ncbi:hypothetical protein [Bacteroides uniformis]|uniref:hypothetical protein n=1 Tax=Bacteroides uniformis TaxID=820 RepID=UPI001896DF63|nr:hypothetical protein [Bacteroides uniformis]MDC1998137.1 hypothetical protein [Bacteroides uniformis]MDC2001901.1 hypothetical protein [Bacteroides uniformis]MDC2005628.1 hypothetical protein [Bacteroides uniformis]
MYRRFLNNNDYLSVITPEALAQLTRGNDERFVQAEEAAEMSVVEYLSENYEIEKELAKGKYIAGYDRRITYPVGVHIYFEGQIHEVIRSISGYRKPATVIYWQECSDINIDTEQVANYSQFNTYYPGDKVNYNGMLYTCLAENGYKFDDVRIPMVCGWLEAMTETWQPVEYPLWSVVEYDGSFYTLMNLDGSDNNADPFSSDCWGAIADYDPAYNDYELSEHEYVVYDGRVFYPETDVNTDIPQVGRNLSPHDPRNYNLKKHMVRLAVYELAKLIAPNNVSIVRMRDYEDSMKWLNDAAKLRLNPQIPRKLDETKKPVTDWQLATFQTDYDPYRNPWLV